MDDTQVLAVGRVRWFDPAAGQGVITGVGGSTYVFVGEPEHAGLDIGQVVTFRDAGRGPIGRMAAGVRPMETAAVG